MTVCPSSVSFNTFPLMSRWKLDERVSSFVKSHSSSSSPALCSSWFRRGPWLLSALLQHILMRTAGFLMNTSYYQIQIFLSLISRSSSQMFALKRFAQRTVKSRGNQLLALFTYLKCYHVLEECSGFSGRLWWVMFGEKVNGAIFAVFIKRKCEADTFRKHLQ